MSSTLMTTTTAHSSSLALNPWERQTRAEKFANWCQDVLYQMKSHEIVRGLGWITVGLVCLLFVLFVLPHRVPVHTEPDAVAELRRELLQEFVHVRPVYEKEADLRELRLGVHSPDVFKELAHHVYLQWQHAGLEGVQEMKFDEFVIGFTRATQTFEGAPGAYELANQPLPGPQKHASVIGYIRGEFEPDSYVMLGTSYSVHDYSLALLLNITERVQHLIANTDWRPYRSLLFFVWAHEHQSPRAWIARHAPTLAERVVAYIDMSGLSHAKDLSVFATVDAHAVVVNASRDTPRLRGQSYLLSQPRVTNDTLSNKGLSWLGIVRSNGSQLPFLSQLGVPTIQIVGINTTHASHLDEYDNINLSYRLIQDGIIVKTALFVMEMLRILVDMSPIPVSIQDVCTEMQRDLRITLSRARRQLQGKDSEVLSSLGSLIEAAGHCAKTTTERHEQLFNETDDAQFWVEARAFNARIVRASRCFLTQSPATGAARHLLYGYEQPPKLHVLLPHLYNLLDDHIRLKSAATQRRVLEELGRLRNSLDCVDYCFRPFV